MSVNIKQKAPDSALYGMGFFGAVIYYISVSTSFMGGVWGFVKALFWPAFLVYEALKYMGV